MAVTIVLSVLSGLLVADVLSFFIYCLSEQFSDENENKKAKNNQKKLIKKYINYIFKEFINRRKSFILYYLILDSTTVAITLLMILLFGVTLQAALALVFAYSLIVLTFVDAKTQYLPDIITKPLIFWGLVQGYFGVFTDWKSSLIGALAGYWVLWGINFTFKLIRKKDGMGGGDFKLLSAIGAWIGWTYLPFVVFAASVIGIFVAVAMDKLGKNHISNPNPFGPALSIAGIVAMCWGEAILGWYLGLYTF